MEQFMTWAPLVTAVLGIVLTILRIVEVLLKMIAARKHPTQPPRPPILRPWVAWVLLAVISVLFLILLWNMPVQNRLITRYDFERTDDGWSRVDTVKYAEDGRIESKFSTGGGFPGSVEKELSKEHALTGQRSLKVTTSVTDAGSFKSYLYREGTLSAHGATIFVLAPATADADRIDYVQMCVPSHGWICTGGTDLVPGEWTPVTIDLSRSDDSGIALYDQKITELAVQ